MEHVVQFDTNQRTSPGFEIQEFYAYESRQMRKQAWTGAAWLSSVRSVRSALKWDNERNPCPQLQVSADTARPLDERKEGRTSSQHGPYALGYTHVTMRKTTGFAS